MRSLFAIAAIVGIAAAAPSQLAKRIIIANDLKEGTSDACPTAILIYARGSTEPGNLGILLGPPLANSMSRQIDDIWIQGIGFPYTASGADNALPRGTSDAAIAEGVRLYEMAHTKCPDSAVVTSGYSQGAALVAAALSDLTPEVQDQVKGALLFGYTKNQENEGHIPNFPDDKLRNYCAENDSACDTGPDVGFFPHLTYGDEASGEGADFLVSKALGT